MLAANRHPRQLDASRAEEAIDASRRYSSTRERGQLKPLRAPVQPLAVSIAPVSLLWLPHVTLFRVESTTKRAATIRRERRELLLEERRVKEARVREEFCGPDGVPVSGQEGGREGGR